MLLKPPSASYWDLPPGSGGGITVLAAGSIVITSSGSVSAVGLQGSPFVQNGPPFAYASAGGIVILASRTSINNAATLIATGGNGADGNADSAGGGGGGGGIIHLLGPSLVLGNP